jgi:hypothetical protein
MIIACSSGATVRCASEETSAEANTKASAKTKTRF